MSRLASLPLFVVMVPIDAVASPSSVPGWVVDHWTMEDGLPVDHLSGVTVDTAGQVYIATLDGLAVYDGQSFDVLRAGQPDGPTSTRLRNVRADPHGGVWVVDERQNAQFRGPSGAHRVDLGGAAALGSPFVWDDAVWIQTTMALVRMDGDGSSIPTVPRLHAGVDPDGSVVGLQADSRLWWRIDPRTGESSQSEVPLDGPLGMARNPTTGRLGILHGSEFYDPDAARSTPATDTGLRSPDSPARPSDWGYYDTSVYHRDQMVATLTSPVRGVVEDGDTVWVATEGSGLVRVRPTPIHHVLPPSGEPDNISRLWLDDADGTLWAHYATGGWWAVPDREDGSPSARTMTLPESCIPWTTRPFRGPDGARWFACADQVVRPVGDGWESVVPAERQQSGPVWHTSRGVLLGGERSTPAVYTAGDWQIITDPGNIFHGVYALVERPTGEMLLGGMNGLDVVLPGEFVARELDPQARLGWIRHLREHDGVLYVGTIDHGLCAVDADAVSGVSQVQPRCLGLDSTLDRTTVHATAADDSGHTWISTNQGIAVSPTADLARWAEGGEEPPILWFGAEDGLIDPEMNGYMGDALVRTHDGRMWLPNQGGVVVIEPSRFAWPSPPQASVAHVMHDGASYAHADIISLGPDHGPLTLSWRTEATWWSDQVAFRYRLGSSDPWHSVGRSIELATLPPGTTHIQVQAGLGPLWGPVAEVVLHREPALHERATFYLALAMALLGVLWLSSRARARALRRSNERLEAQVAAQTQDLARRNEALLDANAALTDREASLSAATGLLRERNAEITEYARQLAELDSFKRKLIANVSHELRTPLHLIVAPLGVLLAESTPLSREARHLQVAIDNAHHLDGLIGQLFELARLEDTSVRLRVQRVDVAQLIRAQVFRFEAAAAEEGVRLQAHVPEEPVPLWVEPDLIDKTVGNLLSNALRHGPPGSTVSVRLTVAPDTVRIEVEDEGPGVPPALHDAVFDRFVQSNDHGAVQGGAGIGLSLAKELVELHGGRIGIDPEATGARFWLVLPRGVAHLSPSEIDLERPPPPPVPTEPDPIQGDAFGAHVLLVEDHPQLRAYLAEVLSEQFVVTQASDGRTGLALARSEPVDVVVSDIMMPHLTGTQLVHALRDDPATHDMPILLMSAKGELRDRLDGLGVADDYLAKPFAASELVARLHALLRRSGRTDADGTTQAQADLETQGRRFDEALDTAARPHLADRAFGAAQLARTMGMSLRSLQLRLAALHRPPPGEWLRAWRLDHGEVLLKSGRFATVADVAHAVGMSRSYFTRLYGEDRSRSPGADLISPTDDSSE